jgi:methionyl-tRNA synthetase
MKLKSYYLTTTLPYVNAAPHIGFAQEIIEADTIARYKELSGFNVFFNFGTDEHGKKIYDKAIELKMDPKKYCDEYAAKFRELKKSLNLSYNNFIRTTDPHHIEAAQKFWRRCKANGDIYKKNYKTKYCVGCELEKSDSELEDNHCPLHPTMELEIIEEENYFFRFSKYQNKLLELYGDNPKFVIPDYRLNEIKEFVKKGLQDFSISRLKNKMPWGIDVPDDSSHVMYVWFDALINYISAIGWPSDMNTFNTWWPVTQFAGKDNLRQQSAIWQAMLLSAGLPNSKQIFIHGFISVNGQKISKSLGNVIDPYTLVSKYGTDAVRYYLLKEIPSYSDGDYSQRRFKEVYNADLANGLGNLVARIARLAAKVTLEEPQVITFDEVAPADYREADKIIDEKTPWKLTDKELTEFIQDVVPEVREIAMLLQPFLPATSDKILTQFSQSHIHPQPSLFPRLS